MLRGIEDMTGHVIIAGWGRMGHAIAQSVGRAGQEIVVVDRESADDVSDHSVVVGEATEDDVLRAAGVERAETLIAALSSDADNLFLTLSARRMRPDLFIVARPAIRRTNPSSSRPAPTGWSTRTRSAAHAWRRWRCNPTWPSSSTRCSTTRATTSPFSSHQLDRLSAIIG